LHFYFIKQIFKLVLFDKIKLDSMDKLHYIQPENNGLGKVILPVVYLQYNIDLVAVSNPLLSQQLSV